MTRKTTQPRLLPKRSIAPIGQRDALPFAALSTRYRCRCGNTFETGIRLEEAQCVKCGGIMKPQICPF